MKFPVLTLLNLVIVLALSIVTTCQLSNNGCETVEIKRAAQPAVDTEKQCFDDTLDVAYWDSSAEDFITLVANPDVKTVYFLYFTFDSIAYGIEFNEYLSMSAEEKAHVGLVLTIMQSAVYLDDFIHKYLIELLPKRFLVE